MQQVHIPSAPWLGWSRRRGASIPESLTHASWVRTLSIEVFRAIDEHTWIGSGNRVASETLYIIEGDDKAVLIDAGTHIPGLDKIVAGSQNCDYYNGLDRSCIDLLHSPSDSHMVVLHSAPQMGLDQRK